MKEYDQFTAFINDDQGNVLPITVNGTGTINGSNLSETGTFIVVVDNQQYNGTWIRNSVKQ